MLPVSFQARTLRKESVVLQHGRILRPRQVFPEFAALWIQLRRGLLRLAWYFGRLDLWFPPWVTAAATGTLGIMLAILLFFLRGPSADASIVRPEPTPIVPLVAESIIVPTPAIEPLTVSKLSTRLIRTRLDELWDQHERVTVVSKPLRDERPWQKLLAREADLWKISIPCRAPEVEHLAYALKGSGIPLAPVLVATSNRPHPDPREHRERAASVILQKILPGEKSTKDSPYTYEIAVRNPSQEPVDGVVVRELLSQIDHVVAVEPVAAVQGNELVWSLGTLGPLAEHLLRITIVPRDEEQLDTQVTLAAISQFASSVTRVKQPIVPMVLDIPEPARPLEPTPVEIPPVVEEPVARVEPEPQPEPPPVQGSAKLKLTASPVTNLYRGENLQVVYTVTNVGTAEAEDVEISVRLSEQLEHRHGRQVRHAIVKLAPGESHTAVFRASAKDVGEAYLNTSLQMQGAEQAKDGAKFRITQSQTRPRPAPRHVEMSCPDFVSFGG